VFVRIVLFSSVALLGTWRAAAIPPAGGAATGPESCALHSEALGALKVHRDLLAVAGQYFHSEHRGGFDAFRSEAAPAYQDDGDVVFPWFEVQDLERPVTPPRGVRIVISLRGGYLVTRRLPGQCCREELGFLKRDRPTPRWLGLRLYPDSAVETRFGEIWAITRGQRERGQEKPPVRLLHIGVDGKADDKMLDVSDWARDTELALTADDRPALVFLRRDAGILRLLLSWSLDPSTAILLDEVEVPIEVAKLSQRTGVAISVAADGKRGVGVAWRPLTDRSSTGAWTVPTAGEVRWLTVEPEGPATHPRRHATNAQPRGFYGGHGPYGLAGNGLRAGTFGGRAFFVWIEGADIVGVRSTDDVPTLLAPSDAGVHGLGAPMIDLRQRGDSLDLILFHSAPRVSAFRVRCASDAPSNAPLKSDERVGRFAPSPVRR